MEEQKNYIELDSNAEKVLELLVENFKTQLKLEIDESKISTWKNVIKELKKNIKKHKVEKRVIPNNIVIPNNNVMIESDIEEDISNKKMEKKQEVPIVTKKLEEKKEVSKQNSKKRKIVDEEEEHKDPEPEPICCDVETEEPSNTITEKEAEKRNPMIDYSGKYPCVKRDISDQFFIDDEDIWLMGVSMEDKKLIEISTSNRNSALYGKYGIEIANGLIRVRYNTQITDEKQVRKKVIPEEKEAGHDWIMRGKEKIIDDDDTREKEASRSDYEDWVGKPMNSEDTPQEENDKKKNSTEKKSVNKEKRDKMAIITDNPPHEKEPINKPVMIQEQEAEVEKEETKNTEEKENMDVDTNTQHQQDGEKKKKKEVIHRFCNKCNQLYIGNHYMITVCRNSEEDQALSVAGYITKKMKTKLKTKRKKFVELDNKEEEEEAEKVEMK